MVGKRWMWKAQHMTGQREINELHVPVGVPVKLTLTSEDVIHSFFIPAFRVKQDAIPGRYTTMWFEATKPGALPPLLRRVLRHQALGDDRLRSWSWSRRPSRPGWPGGAGEVSLAAAGEKLFQELGCVTCHRADSEGRGPRLRGPVRAAGAARRRRDGGRRRGLHPRVDREPGGQGGGRLPADHADLPGPGDARKA